MKTGFDGDEVVQTFVIEKSEQNKRIDQILATKFPILSRKSWQKRINSHEVLINDRPCRPSRIGQFDEKISFRFKKRKEPPVDTRFNILYEDNYLIAIDKPSKLPVHPSGTYYENTLTSLLEGRYQRKFYLVHRLDRETSGVILLAKNKQTARSMQQAFYHKRVLKYYLVAVEGLVSTSFSARGYIDKDEKSTVKKKKAFSIKPVSDKSQTTSTFFRPVQFSPDYDLSLLMARLHTGRLHQIRATLCSLGLPVVGDKIYGIDETLFLRFIADALSEDDHKRMRIDRSALHCMHLKLRHPESKKLMKIYSKIPEDIQKLFNRDMVGGMAPSLRS